MKTLLLLLSLPLFSFSQEMHIGVKVGESWSFSSDILVQANLAIDSLTYDIDNQNPSSDSSTNDIYDIDSVKYLHEGIISIYLHDDKTVVSVDRMIVVEDNDTLWTTPDPVMYACLNTCRVDDCIGGCYKKADCGCDCVGSGGCSDVNLAIVLDSPFGELVRERILTSHGNEIPKE